MGRGQPPESQERQEHPKNRATRTTKCKPGNIGDIKNQPRRAALPEAEFALLPLIAAAAGIPQGTAGAQAPNGSDTRRLIKAQVSYTD